MKRDKKGHFVKKTIAQKVRDLNEQGMTRSEIAKTLNIRYQRVRNVLVPRVTADEPAEGEAEAVEPVEEPTADELEAIEVEA
jgi:orotate phosphoribosyltransferase-like protein